MELRKDYSISQHFWQNLAQILWEKIFSFYEKFDLENYLKEFENLDNSSYSQRVEFHAKILKKYLPEDFEKACEILKKILWPENPNQTWMFKQFYWILPIWKYVEFFWLKNFSTSIDMIENITKRNTWEYAIRPFINLYPEKTLQVLQSWSKDKNFHLRRLASEGIRPKLPWAKKLDIFVDRPEKVFEILENLMEDKIMFVKKSVANNIADYLKVNPQKALEFIKKYQNSSNINTAWIIKHATRKFNLK